MPPRPGAHSSAPTAARWHLWSPPAGPPPPTRTHRPQISSRCHAVPGIAESANHQAEPRPVGPAGFRQLTAPAPCAARVARVRPPSMLRSRRAVCRRVWRAVCPPACHVSTTVENLQPYLPDCRWPAVWQPQPKRPKHLRATRLSQLRRPVHRGSPRFALADFAPHHPCAVRADLGAVRVQPRFRHRAANAVPGMPKPGTLPR